MPTTEKTVNTTTKALSILKFVVTRQAERTQVPILLEGVCNGLKI